MNDKLNLLIVEDQKVFAQGLRAMLQTNDTIAEVEFALNYEECFDKLKWEKFTIVILDINFDQQYNGVDIAIKIKELYPKIKILILTQRVKLEYYKPLMKEIKVDGYLDKKLDMDEIFKAIDTVMNGDVYLDKRIEAMVEIKELMQLSELEKQIIELLGDGLSQKEIGEKIFRTEKTVQYHLTKLYLKTESNNAVELVKKYNNYKAGNREISSWN